MPDTGMPITDDGTVVATADPEAVTPTEPEAVAAPDLEALALAMEVQDVHGETLGKELARAQGRFLRQSVLADDAKPTGWTQTIGWRDRTVRKIAHVAKGGSLTRGAAIPAASDAEVEAIIGLLAQ